LIEAGKISSDKRNELVLISDVLGVETLVDMYVPPLDTVFVRALTRAVIARKQVGTCSFRQ
jgi:hypothetical protein